MNHDDCSHEPPTVDFKPISPIRYERLGSADHHTFRSTGSSAYSRHTSGCSCPALANHQVPGSSWKASVAVPWPIDSNTKSAVDFDSPSICGSLPPTRHSMVTSMRLVGQPR